VHPTVASLNSLARILRQATPLYTECRSILNESQRSTKQAAGFQCNSTAFVPAATEKRPTFEDEVRTKRSGRANVDLVVNSTSETRGPSQSHKEPSDQYSDRSLRARGAKKVWEPHNEAGPPSQFNWFLTAIWCIPKS
jgi:hypothetical protein